jgi:putative methionine-R-sulfoxide reductase with GAF domain
MKAMPTAAAKTQLVKKEIDHLATTALTADELMQGIVRKLNERMLKYNWVGFYML